jgi:nitroreductase
MMYLRKLKRFIFIWIHFLYDGFSYMKHSSVFNYRTQKKLEGKISFIYHSLEKGLINDPIRYRFGLAKVQRLILYLNIWVKRKYDTDNSQFIAACSVLVRYYQLHNEQLIDISDFFNDAFYKKIWSYYDVNAGGVIESIGNEYFNQSKLSFDLFSASRHSVRHFNGDLVPVEEITKVIELAKKSPSVCNRQSVNIKFINNRDLVQKILAIQSGLNTLAKSVNQLFVVTSDKNYFVSEGERNQCYIDGGIYLLNLLYSLHFYNIAACPLHAAFQYKSEIKVRKLLKMKASETIVAFVAIGYPAENFKFPVSKRKKTPEILQVIEK